MPPAALSPGDRIWSPGGWAVVLGVDSSASLVRVAFRDVTGRAFVYLPRSRDVLRQKDPR